MATNYDKGTDIAHRSYNDPAGLGNANESGASSIGNQFNTFYWQKKALIELKKDQYFSQMASTTAMPKHFGKTIKKYLYLPLLDDRNMNDQGINAAGAAQATTDSWAITGVSPASVIGYLDDITGSAVFDATSAVQEWNIRYPDGVNTDGNLAASAAAVGASGNIYGSSKDVGTISAKLPALSEHGGRVNRVGFKRVELEGSIEKFGFFDEYTQESMDFDTDSELMMHVNREMLRGANEMTEDALQIDLLNGAGVVRYGGSATSKATIDETSQITYADLMRLNIDLDNNRCPKNTKIITGSRMVDTRTIDGARYMYVGSELIPMLKAMTDGFGNPAFIPVHQYAAAGTIATGEIGSIDQFRIIVVPEMMKWVGEGADSTGVTTHYSTDGVSTAETFDVFPMLVVGSESFTTIGFQTDGKTVKFKITHKKPGTGVANRDDPYGEVGFMSIKWYYGSMIMRPERLAVCLTSAPL